MSAKGIPQIAVVMGSCTAGGAYVPAMSDETVIVRGTGTIFLGGPPLVKAATGEEVTAEELGGADVHTRISGVADHFAVSDEHALALARADRRATSTGASPTRRGTSAPAEEPLYDPEEIYGIVPDGLREAATTSASSSPASWTGAASTSSRRCYGDDPRLRLRPHRRLPGGDPGEQRRPLLGERAEGRALRRALRASGACPLLFLQNITGFMVGKEYEPGGIAKDGAKMVTAVACAQVPKFTVIVGGSFGAGNYGMCGRAYGPRLLWMWPNARISVMGGEQAATVLLDRARASRRPRGGRSRAHPEVRARRKPVLLDRAALGRRRSSTRLRHASVARARASRPRSTRRSPRRRSASSGCSAGVPAALESGGAPYAPGR